ncbi:MAG: AAA family ATPase [Elusimicrobia bacterium]|nr:AAA family ATPase [Elusimicrobiota bacterium]
MNFGYIEGHRKNIGLIKKMLSESRLPHALLFSGIEGIGKRLTATALAAAVNCEKRSEEGACGECESCRKLRAGTHPSVKFIGSPKNESGIEAVFGAGSVINISNIVSADEDNKKRKTAKINIYQVREIIRDASLRAYGRSSKVYIIDDISEASTEALNCLLKVLEEPPAGTFFILVTSRIQALLSTITSRCQRLEFNPLGEEELKRVLDRKGLAEGLPAGRADELVGVSSGSCGKFLRFVELENIIPQRMEPEDFFLEVSKWFSSSGECIRKLQMLIELEGIGFRKSPSSERYARINIMEDTLNQVKSNVNPELAVSNMFLKLGYVNL